MTAPWYLIVVTPTGTHVYPVVPADDAGRAAAVSAARRTHSVPADDVDAAGWDLSLSQGEPHPSLLARPDVTLHDQPPA